MSNTAYKLIKIMRREVLRIATKPMYLFCMIIAPLLCYVFFATLMSNGLPTDLPAGVVDLDNTSTTRNIIRNLDAFQQTKIVAMLSTTYLKVLPRKHSPAGSLRFRSTPTTHILLPDH